MNLNREIHTQYITLEEARRKRAIGQGEMASSCARGDLDWVLGKISSLKEL